MKRKKREIYMRRNATLSDDLDGDAFRERLSNLRELVNDVRKRAEDVTCTLEGVGEFGLPVTAPTAANELDFYSEVRRFEIFLIRNALRRAKGSQVKAARLL